MVKISVIIPVYNVEAYLYDTFNCLINQTIFEDIEIFAVDDGSTDNSRYIIENFALDYDNIHAFHKANERQGIARNFALEMAKGEYIHFLDADDYIPPAYETFYNIAKEHDSDIVIGDVLRFREKNIWSDSLFKNSYKDIEGDIESTTLSQMPSLFWDTSTSNKLYKREFIESNNIRFPSRKIFFEDLAFSLEAYIKASSIYISKKIFYYWRLRPKMTSVTQQHKSIRNFHYRLEILKILDDIMKENNLSENLVNFEYRKWLNHDLRIFLKKLINYPSMYHEELIGEVNEILGRIPNHLFDELNSYKRVIYAMVKDNDIDGLLSFAHLEASLAENPQQYIDIDEKYFNLIDFEKDGIKEDLVVKVVRAYINEEKKLAIKFMESIKYIDPNRRHKTVATLVDENGKESRLKVEDDVLYIPFNLIKNKLGLRIKIRYVCSSFTKETYLRNNGRKSFNCDGLDINLNMGCNSLLFIDAFTRVDAKLEIINAEFDGKHLILTGNAFERIDSLLIRNIVTFNKVTYPLEYGDGTFRLEIPYSDILNSPIKKWELMSGDAINYIELKDEFDFFIQGSKISIVNLRNKILIENNISNEMNELHNMYYSTPELIAENERLSEENEILSQENREISKYNKELNNIIDTDYKSRFLVRLVDSIKRIKS